jgi:hypothetical protein
MSEQRRGKIPPYLKDIAEGGYEPQYKKLNIEPEEHVWQMDQQEQAMRRNAELTAQLKGNKIQKPVRPQRPARQEPDKPVFIKGGYEARPPGVARTAAGKPLPFVGSQAQDPSWASNRSFVVPREEPEEFVESLQDMDNVNTEMYEGTGFDDVPVGSYLVVSENISEIFASAHEAEDFVDQLIMGGEVDVENIAVYHKLKIRVGVSLG